MNTLKIKTLLSGPRNLLLAIYMKSDGASGDFVDEVLVDPVDYGLKAKSRLRLVRMEYSFAGFDACLSYGSGLVDANFKWVMSETSNHPVDFQSYGNLIDDSGLDGTGLLTITTTGFTSTTDQGSILLGLRKP